MFFMFTCQDTVLDRIDPKRLSEIARGHTPTADEKESIANSPEQANRLKRLQENHKLALDMFLRGS